MYLSWNNMFLGPLFKLGTNKNTFQHTSHPHATVGNELNGQFLCCFLQEQTGDERTQRLQPKATHQLYHRKDKRENIDNSATNLVNSPWKCTNANHASSAVWELPPSVNWVLSCSELALVLCRWPRCKSIGDAQKETSRAWALWGVEVSGWKLRKVWLTVAAACLPSCLSVMNGPKYRFASKSDPLPRVPKQNCRWVCACGAESF